FEVEFKDENSTEYLWNGEWVSAEKKEEIIKNKNGKDEIVTLLWTHVGLVVHREKNLGLALLWKGHSPGVELKAFLNLSKSHSLGDCKKSVEETYFNPTQNLACADKKEVAIYHVGKIPAREKINGGLVRNGRFMPQDWKSTIPFGELPQNINNPSDMIYSANQRPVTSQYKYYLSWDFHDSYRAKRIGELLKENKGKISLDLLKHMQMDDLSIHARNLLPALIVGVSKEVQSENKDFFEGLKTWDYHMKSDLWQPGVFYYWWKQVEENLFIKTLGPKARNAYPPIQHTVDLLRDAFLNSPYYDQKNYWFLGNVKSKEEVQKELTKIITDSFLQLNNRLKTKYGEAFHKWRWDLIQKTVFPHPLKVEAFGRYEISASGSRYAINANFGEHGATWRQIVKLGEDFEALTNFPGGQSGNPFDPKYDNFLEDWAKGEYKKIHFLEKPSVEDKSEVPQ
ncbi:MAG: penicillin acylase family protein, partial [Bdellovibrionales bacterium]|nr:penicillin acylase family protein [Bdellovibrionales bacterium]